MTIEIRRSFLEGISMGEAVVREREETISMLIEHGFTYAPLALRKTASYREFIALRSALLAGEPRLVRLKGGRNIDEAPNVR